MTSQPTEGRIKGETQLLESSGVRVQKKTISSSKMKKRNEKEDIFFGGEPFFLVSQQKVTFRR